jgi:hypothetical protein
MGALEEAEWLGKLCPAQGKLFLPTHRNESIRLSGDEKAPKRDRRMTASPELMLMVVRSPDCVLRRRRPPKGGEFCSCIQPLSDYGSSVGRAQPDEQHPFRKLVLYADNARVRTSEMVDDYFQSPCLSLAHHPPYSPNLARSDFFLFALIGGLLKGTHFPDGQALMCEVRWIHWIAA